MSLWRTVKLICSVIQLCFWRWRWDHLPALFFLKCSLLPRHSLGCHCPLTTMSPALAFSLPRTCWSGQVTCIVWPELTLDPSAGWRRKCKRIICASAATSSSAGSHSRVTSSFSFPQPDAICLPYWFTLDEWTVGKGKPSCTQPLACHSLAMFLWESQSPLFPTS